MAHQAVLDAATQADAAPRDGPPSFVNADGIIEATQADATPYYIAEGTSYISGHRDTGRALRNADFLTRFTALLPVRPAIASVRNDRELSPGALHGNVFWYPIPGQFWEPE